MSTHKRIDVICIVSVIFAVALAVWLMGTSTLGILPVMGRESSNGMFTANDLDGDWDASLATRIELSDSGSIINGNGAYVHDGDVYIAYAGHYVLTGELTKGSIMIDADKSDKIWLLLDGVTLHCDDDAAIRIEQADKVFLTLSEGSENTVSSGTQYEEEAVSAGVDGAIYSRDDLTVNGKGSLAVSAGYCHGIVCNDDLVITGGNITISAVQDGIHANDSVRICDSSLSISAWDDGITVSNDEETAFLYVASGDITILDCYEGLEAVDITIAGGTIEILASDDGINAAGSGENSVIRISGGDIRVINPSGRDADGLDSNGSIYVEGGSLFISVPDNGGNCAIDYGSENGGECVVSGGRVIACGGNMMAEGFDADSPQGFLVYETSKQAGTAISLADAGGKEILAGEIPYSFSLAVLSAPEMKVGEVCTITVGDTKEQLTIDNSTVSAFIPAGMFGGGRETGENRNRMSDAGKQAGGQDMEPPERMETPEGMEPRDDIGAFIAENMPGREDGQETGGISLNTLALLGASLLILLSGLLIAMKTKH